jgi:hypothetical protein
VLRLVPSFALNSLANEEGLTGDADFLDMLSPFPPLDELRGDTRPVCRYIC